MDHTELRSERVQGAWIWPTAIVVGLLIVVVVNIGFVTLAVGGADEVVESYSTEAR